MHKEITRNFTRKLAARLGEKLNFIQVVLGPRQVGKTTGLLQIIKKWKGPSLIVTSDEVTVPTREWLGVQWQRAQEMGKNVLFVVDEVQKIPDWSSAVKYLYDQDRSARQMKVVLLGSASLSLQKGLHESLAGRYEVIIADHWGLPECHEAFGWGFKEYVKFGGYPAACELVRDISRWQNYMKNSIIEPVLIKDILGLSAVNKPALFRQTFELAMHYPAQEISLQKLLGQLQETGNVNTIKHYLELCEGAFLLKTLEKYSGSAVRRKGSSPKILPLSNSLIHAFTNPEKMATDPDWRGRILETVVGQALTRLGGELFYWRNGKFELDYVLRLDGKLYAIEVKSNRRRASRGLEMFKQAYPSSIPLIIDYERAVKFLEKESLDILMK